MGALEFVIPGCKPEVEPRLAAKKVHLTYAALYDGELTFDMLLNAAKAWGTRRGGLREYCICHELHAQPADPQRDHHFHAYFEFGKKVDVDDRFRTTIFDVQGSRRRYLHPEVQAVGGLPGDRERVITYDMRTVITCPSCTRRSSSTRDATPQKRRQKTRRQRAARRQQRSRSSRAGARCSTTRRTVAESCIGVC